MAMMNFFSKNELKVTAIILLVLFAVSAPNFVVSLRRARDQIRRDDMGSMQHMLDTYYSAYKEFPKSSPNGGVLGCLETGENLATNEQGEILNTLIECQWGKDPLLEFTSVIPGDPNLSKGVTYKYFSEGSMYQLFASFEGSNEAEYDEKIVERQISCGKTLCNVGRFYSCSVYKSLKQCQEEMIQKK